MDHNGEQIGPADAGFSAPELHREGEMGRENEPSATEFKFALCEHEEPDNATLAAAALKDCEIIALENLGGSPEERADIQLKMNQYLRQANDPALEDASEDIIRGFRPFTRQLLHSLARYPPKKIVMIDGGDDVTSIAQTIEPYDRAEEIFRRGSFSRGSSLAEMRQGAADYVQASATRDGAREELQSRQLQHLAHPEAGDPPASVGVLLGLEHSPTKDVLDRLGYRTTQRQIHVLSPGFLKQEIPISYATRASQALRTRQEQPSAALLNRVVLERVYSGDGHNVIWPEPPPSGHISHRDAVEQVFENATKTVEAMEDSEIDTLLNRLDQVRVNSPEDTYGAVESLLEEHYASVRER